jgi:hypothetical protein
MSICISCSRGNRLGLELEDKRRFRGGMVTCAAGQQQTNESSAGLAGDMGCVSAALARE